MTKTFTISIALAATSLFAANPNGGTAPDGATLIDQARAITGGITSGDAPGFPVTISEPGLYRLVGNLVLTSPTDVAILATSSHVLIDLNGFTISGPNQCSNFMCKFSNGSAAGIRVSDLGKTNLTIRNGVIRGMGSSAIAAGALARIEGVHVESNAFGIQLGGGAIVRDCRAVNNGGFGFYSDGGSLLLRNISAANGIGFSFGALPVAWGSNSAFGNKTNQTVVAPPLALAPNLCVGTGGICQ